MVSSLTRERKKDLAFVQFHTESFGPTFVGALKLKLHVGPGLLEIEGLPRDAVAALLSAWPEAS